MSFHQMFNGRSRKKLLEHSFLVFVLKHETLVSGGGRFIFLTQSDRELSYFSSNIEALNALKENDEIRRPTNGSYYSQFKTVHLQLTLRKEREDKDLGTFL